MFSKGNYYYCSSCNKRIELKYKKTHLKSDLHMNTVGTVISKYAIMNPELCEINHKLINTVETYDKWFELFKILCEWKFVLDNDFSIDVKSKVLYRISVVRHNLEKYLKKINY